VVYELHARWISKLLYNVWSRFKLANIIAGNGQWQGLDLIIMLRVCGSCTPKVRIRTVTSTLRYTFRLYVRTVFCIAEVPPRERTIIATWKRQLVSGERYYACTECIFSSRTRLLSGLRAQQTITTCSPRRKRNVSCLRNKTSRPLVHDRMFPWSLASTIV